MSRSRNIFSSKIGQTLLTSIPRYFSVIFVSILITRLVGSKYIGIFGVVSLNLELFTLFLSLSISSSISYFIAKEKLSTAQVASVGFGIITGGLTLILIAYLTFKYFGLDFILNDQENQSIWIVIFFLTSFICNLFKEFAAGILQAHHQISRINRTTIINTLVTSATILVLYIYAYDVLNKKESFQLIIKVMTCLSLVTSIPFLYYYISITKKQSGKYLEALEIRKDLIPFIKYSFYAHLSNILNHFNYKIDQWILFLIVGVTYNEFGYYIRAVATAQIVWLIPTAITLTAHPIFCESPTIMKLKSFVGLNNLLTYIMVILSFILAPFIIPFIYGAEFSASVIPFQILLLGMIFSGVTKVLASYNVATGEIRSNLYATIIGLIVTLIFDFTLIPYFGIIGAAIATNLTYLSILLTVAYFLIKNNKELTLISIFLPSKNLNALKS